MQPNAEEIRDFLRDAHGAERNPVDRDSRWTAAAYGLMGLAWCAFALWLFSLFVPTTADTLRAAGALKGCVERSLSPAECSAYAQERH